MSNEPRVPTCVSPLAAARAALRCGAHSKRTGLACQGPAMTNGRCRLHGGASTGPRTAEGKARSAAARWRHGRRSAAVRALAKERAAARAVAAELRTLLADLDTLERA